jgi:hypothetical protein
MKIAIDDYLTDTDRERILGQHTQMAREQAKTQSYFRETSNSGKQNNKTKNNKFNKPLGIFSIIYRVIFCWSMVLLHLISLPTRLELLV